MIEKSYERCFPKVHHPGVSTKCVTVKYHLWLPLLGLLFSRELFTYWPLSQRVHITHVLDGDTLALRGGERLRLAAVDAPEKGQPTRRGGIDAGLWSQQCLSRLIRQGEWRLISQGRDIYGRLLGDLWQGGESLSERLLQSGCVSTYPRVRRPHYHRLKGEAQRARRGLWAFGGFERPYWWRKKKGPPKWALERGGKASF